MNATKVTTPARRRIYLLPPQVGPVGRRSIGAAFNSNSIAPVGPLLAAFEGEASDELRRVAEVMRCVLHDE
jgi:hypothetical protein